MFFFRKKGDKPKINPNPPWVKWLMLAFVAYAIVTNHEKGDKAADKLHDIGTIGMQHVDEFKKTLFPAVTMHSKDVEAGTGPEAACGQEVTIAYDTFLQNNTKLSDGASKDKPLTFRIGENKVIPVLDKGIIGMQVGSKRAIIASPEVSYGIPEFARSDVPPDAKVRFDILLMGLKPELPSLDTSPYRIAIIKSGSGPAIECGKPAKIDMTIWGVDGKKLYSTKDKENRPLTFTPGHSETMMGIELGTIGMLQGSQRTLVLPPEWQATMFGALLSTPLPLPAHQTVLVDVEALP